MPKNAHSVPCGEKFIVSYAFRCANGRYTHVSQNEIRDNFANIMHDVCYDVEVEPTRALPQGESFIHRITITDENPRLDIKTNDLW